MTLRTAKVELGKKLFYDPALSNGVRSCATCHIQTHGFSNNDSVNPLPLVNLIYNQNFLWRGKIRNGSLLDIMRHDVENFFQTNPKWIQTREYQQLFGRAYNDPLITRERIAECLTQFIATMTAGNSKFERFLRGETSLSPSEMRGFQIFMTERGDCFHCHAPPLFSDNQFHNIGLDSVFTGGNQGLYETTKNPADLGKFKTPSLYNVAITPPYMHDGRFKTLEEVIQHYDQGVKLSSTVDPIMTKPGKEDGLNLSPQEIADLIAFLKTLTDSTLLTDPRYRPE
jgi:cytochrome c peroxidase